jgi:hypothetical protein
MPSNSRESDSARREVRMGRMRGVKKLANWGSVRQAAERPFAIVNAERRLAKSGEEKRDWRASVHRNWWNDN